MTLIISSKFVARRSRILKIRIAPRVLNLVKIALAKTSWCESHVPNKDSKKNPAILYSLCGKNCLSLLCAGCYNEKCQKVVI